jgi:tripartite-type tricarboxylate transporter receptor subunit TctC
MRFIVGNAPGGSTGAVARLVADRMSESFGQQVVVDHRSGANGRIASDMLLRATPDGHTLLLVTASLTIRPLLHSNKAYARYMEEFVPVATLVSTEYILVVNPAMPADDVKSFVALVKGKPVHHFKAAVSNIGGTNHLALELFNGLAGTRIQPIAYRGGGPGMTALLAGEVSLAFNNAITVMPHVRGGKLRALGVGGDERLSSLPEVPTFAEAGLPGYSAKNWFGVVVPAGTPRAVVDKLAGEIARIRALPDFRARLADLGVEPFAHGPDQFAAFLEAESVKWAKVVRDAGIRIPE